MSITSHEWGFELCESLTHCDHYGSVCQFNDGLLYVSCS